MSKLKITVLDEDNDYRTDREKAEELEESDRRAWMQSGSYRIMGISYEDRDKPLSFWRRWSMV